MKNKLSRYAEFVNYVNSEKGKNACVVCKEPTNSIKKIVLGEHSPFANKGEYFILCSEHYAEVILTGLDKAIKKYY